MADVIEATVNISAQPTVDFSKMFSEADKVKLEKVIWPAVVRGLNYNRQIAAYKSSSIDRVPALRVKHAYGIIESHLKSSGNFNETIKKFPPKAIEDAIVDVFDRFDMCQNSRLFDIGLFDWAIEFEHLRDYDKVYEWLDFLTTQGKVPPDYEPLIINSCIAELEEKALVLDMAVISKVKYEELLRCKQELTSKTKNRSPRVILLRDL